MFFPCFPFSSADRRHLRSQKLDMLKTMRDALEARLAALNAAIETMERQMQQDQQDTSQS